MARKATRSKRRSARRRRRARAWWARLLLLLMVALVGWGAWLDIGVRARFEGKRFSLPARIYARPLELYPGKALSADQLTRELVASGYHRVAAVERPGSFARRGERVRVATRAFRFWNGAEPARRLRLRFAGSRLVSLREGARPVPLVRLDPALIGRVYPRHHEDRVMVRLARAPRVLVAAVIAVEDRDFYTHFGLSLRGIARAAWADLKAGAAVQGGSTLTQQLAKNLYLGPQRTLWRKANEAAIALLLELHYSKHEILEAYLNEVYLGQEGRRAVHGFGLAARFYFGRRLDELRLPEMALLVGLVRGASLYNPRRRPQRALARRNLVLDILADRGVVSRRAAKAAKSRPLGVSRRAPRGTSPYPAFIDLVRRQLRRDYRDEDLRSEGLRIFTTLDPGTQQRAERALSERIRRLERRRRAVRGRLQGALVVVNPQSGEVTALVGDRDPRRPGFNRALDAVRPIGSLVKPAVFLTALERFGEYTLASALPDGPVAVADAGHRIWSPRNYDGRHRGRLPLYRALAQSNNLATVRLGLALGLPRVMHMLERLGVRRDLPQVPSALLGSVALSPLEVAQMYQTLANGGFRMPLRAIRAVTDADGEPLARYGLSVQQAAAPEAVYLLQQALESVMREGTGRAAYAVLRPSLAVAGKTGTTDGLRDSWFAGFSGDLLAVVWLGRDDNRPAGFTGASGALRVWSDLMLVLDPQPLPAEAPAGIEWHWTKLDGPRRTDPGCSGAVPIPYVAGSAPAYAACARESTRSQVAG